MNSKQKNVLLMTAIVLIITFLFPPFSMVMKAGIANRGFHFIISSEPETVNIGLLFIEWLFVSSICLISWLFFKDRR